MSRWRLLLWFLTGVVLCNAMPLLCARWIEPLRLLPQIGGSLLLYAVASGLAVAAARGIFAGGERSVPKQDLQLLQFSWPTILPFWMIFGGLIGHSYDEAVRGGALTVHSPEDAAGQQAPFHLTVQQAELIDGLAVCAVVGSDDDAETRCVCPMMSPRSLEVRQAPLLGAWVEHRKPSPRGPFQGLVQPRSWAERAVVGIAAKHGVQGTPGWIVLLTERTYEQELATRRRKLAFFFAIANLLALLFGIVIDAIYRESVRRPLPAPPRR